MTLMTGAEYRRSLDDGRQVWIGGARVANVAEHPAFAGMVGAMSAIYDMQHDPAHQAALTFRFEDGSLGSRFYKPPTSPEELRMRRVMTRTVLDAVGPSMDRFGDETVTALFVMQDRRALMDQYDLRYGRAVEGWLTHLQQTNLFMTSGNTDMKGNRAKQPYQQDDLDMYLRVVEERDDGIIVSGAKWETGAAYAHVAFVKPTVGNWVVENRDFAVSFIARLNAPGVRQICRAPLAAGADPFDRPLTARFDEIDSLIIFDHVFVPWEDVIFSRAPELAGAIRSDLVRWAAQGFLMRSQSKAELMVGTACLIAEQSRSIAIPEVKQRIARLMVYAETLRSLVLAAETACERTETGLYMPNQSIQHAGRVFAATYYYQAVQDLRDISGGALIVTPDRASFELPELAADLNKYFSIEDVSAEARIRVLNLANDLTASSYAGRSQAYQIFAESPVYTQALSLYGAYDKESAKARAAKLAGLGA
jgi:4-hydroxyphenylacetate 3-monooxygenase